MGLFAKNSITGIDIGAGSIKIVRIGRSGGQPVLLSASLIEAPLDQSKGEGIGATLRYLVAQKKIDKKNIITLLPGKDLTIRLVTLPKMPEVELREAVRWETKRHVSYPLESALIEYVIIGERREGTVDKYDLLLIAAERATVLEHLVPFKEAGIVVDVVDANALALRNVLRMSNKNGEGNCLVVDMGAGKTEINVFKDNALRFCRCIESGGLDISRAVADQLDIGLEDAEALKVEADVRSGGEDKAAAAVRGRLDILLMEIRRSIEYYKTTFREKRLDRTILTGGVSLTSGITEYFTHALESPVELADPLDGFNAKQGLPREYETQANRFSAAIGLALRKI